MTIEEEDFKLVLSNPDLPLFDLYLLKSINKGKKNEKKEFKIIGYGMTLEHCIKRIATYRLSLKYEENAINLKQFFKEYKEEITQLTSLCKL